jgi:RNA polymerase sigma-70 factor (ECF subfamily)
VIPAQRAPEAALSAATVGVELDAATRWALAAREGDPMAQAAFVRATQTEVWRLAAALVDPDAADDLAQETYLRAFRSLPDFEGRSSARTWLLGITRRVCADHLRSVVRRRRLRSRLEAHPEPERSVMAAAEPDPAQRFASAELLRRLPADRRGAFVLTQLIGLSYAEAAEVEGVPVGTIRSRVARARAELVAVLDEAGAG